jgi:hypothetical protein
VQIGIGEPAVVVELLLLEQRLAQTHDHGALDLTFDRHRIDGRATIVSIPEVQHSDLPGFQIHLDLTHGSRKGVGRRSSHGRPLVGATKTLGRRVVPFGHQRSAFRKVGGGGLLPGNGSARIQLCKDLVVSGLQLGGRHFQDLCGSSDDLFLDLIAGHPGGVATHQGHSTRVGAKSQRSDIAVGRDNLDAIEGDAHGFCGDLPQNGVGALSDIGFTGEENGLGAILFDFDHGV